jgi:hypothetical protein
MADAILSALLGSAQVQSVSTGATTQDATQIPSNLAKLPAGTILKGYVINRDGQNNPILRTAEGDVRIQSQVFLKTGSDVAIRIEQQAQQLHARIISVDDIPIKEYIQQHQPPLPANDQVLQSSLAPRSAAPTVATIDQQTSVVTLNALLLKPTGSPAQATELLGAVFKLPPAIAQAIAQGQPIQFQLVSADLRIAAPTMTQPAIPSQPGIGMPVTSAVQTQPQPQPQAMPLVGMPFSVATPTIRPASYAPYQALQSQNPLSIAQPPPAGTSPVATPGYIATPGQASVVTAPLMAGGTSIGAVPPITAPNPMQPGASTAPTPPGINNPVLPPTPTNAMAAPQVGSPPATATPTPTQPATSEFTPRPHTISARVIGNEPGGETVVRTSVGTFKLFTASPPPPGSILQLELIPPTNISPSPVRTETPIPTTISPFFNYSHDWHNLDEAVQALRSNPVAFAEIAHRIPNTKSEFVNNALFFISALRSGDIRQWLGGRTAGRIDERSPNLMQRLGADFNAMQALSSDRSDQPWQVFLLPLRHDDELHQMRVYLRQEEKEQKAALKKGGTRFVLEVSLSELGDMQLDGFFRKEDRRMQFDLVVRSEDNLPDHVQKDITALYHQGAEVVGYAGQIFFEPHKERFVQPLASSATDQSDSGHSILA